MKSLRSMFTGSVEREEQLMSSPPCSASWRIECGRDRFEGGTREARHCPRAPDAARCTEQSRSLKSIERSIIDVAQAFLCQPLTHGESRFGVEVFYEKGLLEEAGSCCAQQPQS